MALYEKIFTIKAREEGIILRDIKAYISSRQKYRGIIANYKEFDS